jgi:hypothetical protein
MLVLGTPMVLTQILVVAADKLLLACLALLRMMWYFRESTTI